VDPHKIMALSLRYLAEERGWRGTAVRTVSTTRMIDRLAQRYNLVVRETPVGFNHIAEYMLREQVLIGGEESGGISILGHIPEGDGVLMGLLLLEMLAHYCQPLSVLVDDLLREVGPAYYERRDLRLAHPVEKAALTRRLADEAPAHIGGQKVTEVSTRDGCKYILADDSWLLIRPSGTEPVLRVYAEGRSPEMVQALLAYGQQVAERAT
jgi:phosphomannomutase